MNQNKKPNNKTQSERLNNLAAVAGRNLTLSLINEVCELHKRLEKQERLVRHLLESANGKKQVDTHAADCVTI